MAMCEKCSKLEKRIAHYRRLLESISDNQLIGVIIDLIAELEREKAALHPTADAKTERTGGR